MDYKEDYYKGIAGIYFNRILNTIIKLGNLKQEQETILDFGCGVKHLKKKLNKDNVIGYDILEELTEIKDYKTLKPKVIICNAVLEHLNEQEIESTIKDFINMNKNSLLITSIPTENWLSKLGMKLTGLKEAHDDHKTKLKDINKILEKYCRLIKRKKVFTLTEISLWRFL